MTNPNQRLIALMRLHNLDQHDIRKLCRCGRTAVYFWTRPPKHTNFQQMSAAYLRLLELELGVRQRQLVHGI